MRQVVYVRGLKAWRAPDGTAYQAKLPRENHSHGKLDRGVTIHVGDKDEDWIRLPTPGDRHLVNALRKQNADWKNPQMQRYEFQIREEPDEDDDLEAAFSDIPVIRAEKSAATPGSDAPAPPPPATPGKSPRPEPKSQ